MNRNKTGLLFIITIVTIQAKGIDNVKKRVILI